MYIYIYFTVCSLVYARSLFGIHSKNIFLESGVFLPWYPGSYFLGFFVTPGWLVVIMILDLKYFISLTFLEQKKSTYLRGAENEKLRKKTDSNFQRNGSLIAFNSFINVWERNSLI